MLPSCLGFGAAPHAERSLLCLRAATGGLLWHQFALRRAARCLLAAQAARSTEFRFEMYRVLLTPVGALGAFEGRLRADYKSQPSATRLLCAWRCGGVLCHAAGRCTRRADGEAAQMERHDALGQRFLFHDYARRDAETAHRIPDEAALCNCISGAPAAARRVFTLQNLKHKDGSRGKLHLNG